MEGKFVPTSFTFHLFLPLLTKTIPSLTKPPSWGGNTNVLGASVSAIISDVDLLLTGGKLHPSNRALLEELYVNTTIADTSGDPDNKGLQAVLQHFAVTPEFHITSNLHSSASSQVRSVPDDLTVPQEPTPVENYKAIVYLYMAGAADSYSMLVPRAECGALHTQYTEVRGNVAIPSWELRPIDASSSGQPCDFFGLHPKLINIQSMYDAGDASWVANVGPLVEPLNKYEFEAGSKPVPQALFAHNTQTSITQSVFSQDATAGGVLGRIGDVLNAQESQDVFDGYSIDGTPKVRQICEYFFSTE